MSKICPRCEQTNQATATFCNQCGHSLTGRFCGRCGKANTLNARYCQHCSNPLVVSAQQPAPVPAGTGLLPAKTLLANRYSIVKRIAVGGMSAVYLARDTRLTNTHWALKEMSHSVFTDPKQREGALAAFRQEADLLTNLRHPLLPRVTDTFYHSGKQYLVMEYIHGKTLYEVVKTHKQKRLTNKRVYKWLDQLCEVLNYLHTHQPPIIYRDLKPANIMIDKNDNIKLIDFGIARFFKTGKMKDTMAFGTPGYAPPEQYGRGQSDARSDIYSLGATIHFLLTGQDPSNNPFTFKPISQYNRRVSPAFDQIIARCLVHEASDRWSSIRALQQALAKSANQPATVIVDKPIPPNASPPANSQKPPITPPSVAAAFPDFPDPSSKPTPSPQEEESAIEQIKSWWKQRKK